MTRVTGDAVVIEQTGSFSSVKGEGAKPLIDLQTGTAKSLPGDMGKKHEAKQGFFPGRVYDSLIAISPDGKSAATLDMSGSAIRIWDWPAGKLVKTWPLEIPERHGLFNAEGWFTPEKKEFLVALHCAEMWLGSHRGSPMFVDRYDVASGNRLGRQKMDAFSERLIRTDSKLLQVAAESVVDWLANKLIVKLGDEPSRSRICYMKGGMTISPDGLSLAIGGGGILDHGQIEVYDLKSGQLRKTLETKSRSRIELAFLPDGRLISAGDRLLLWDKP